MATAGKTVGFTDKDYVDNEFIDIASAPDEEYLKGDGTWATAAEIIGVGLLLDTLGDVTLTTPADDDFLIYDTATSQWKNEASSTIPTSIGLGTADSVAFGDLSLTGNLVVGGTRTILNTEVLGIVDPLITLQTAADGGPLTIDSNKDVGLGMQYFDGSAKTAFLGFDDSEAKLTFVPDATITNEVVSGAKGTIVADLEGTITAQGDTELYALSQVTSAADKGIQFTGSGTAATYDLTIAGKALLDDADAATQRLTLGLGSVATHSLSSVVAMTASQVPGYLQHLDPASVSILKSGLGTIATHSLSSVLGLLGEPRLPNYITPTTRSILKFGLGTIATHSLSSVLALTQQQIPQVSTRTKLILKSGLGTAATHSLSSILGLIGEPRLPNYITPTTRNILKSGLGTIATHSLSSVLSMMSSTKSLSGMKDIDITDVYTDDIIVYDGIRWVNQKPPNAAGLRALGLGTIATHSLSSVLALLGEPRLPNYISPTTRNILKTGLGTIATHSLSSVVAMMSSTQSISGMKDIDITNATTNDVIVYDGIRWVNQTAPTARLSLGLGSVATHSLSNILAMASGSASASYDPATKNILKAGLGTIATHSLSSVLGLIGEPRLPNYISPTTERILRQGLGTIATKSFATVLSSFDHNTTLKALQDTVVDSATVADNDFLIYNIGDSKWYNRSAATSRTKMGVAIGTDVFAQPSATGSLPLPVGTTGQQTGSQGAIRYNTTLSAFEGYNGSAWGALADPNVSSITRTTYTATGGETSVNVTYTINQLSVYLNGVKLLQDVDFTASNGTSITGLTALAATDHIDFVDYGIFNSADVVPLSTGGTFLGDIFAPNIGTIAKHSLSSVLAMMSSTTSISGMKDIDITGVSTNDVIVYDGIRWVNQTPSTARLSLGLGTIATHSLSSVLAIASGSASATYSPATKNILKAGLGTIATHSLSSVIAMARGAGPTEREVIQLIGETVTGTFVDDLFPVTLTDFVSAANGGTFLGDIFAPNIGTIAKHSLASVLAMARGASPTEREVIQLIGENVTPATDFVSKASGGTFLGDIFASNLSGTNTGDQTLPTDFVSKASGGTFSGNIDASNLSGTNTGDQTLPTDFVSAASGGAFSGNISATNLSGTNTGDQTLPTDFVSAANGGTFSDKVMISKVSAGFTADSHFKLENLGDVDQDRTGILWRTRSANGGKAWFGFEKMLNYGRGDFVWMLDNAQDDNTVTTTDEMLRLRHLTGSLEPGADNTQDLGSGSKRWNTVYGRATSANWSDLAERYEADKYYDEGTVLAIGGEKEVTEYVKGMPFAGVVSIHPGLRMNDKLEYEDNPNFPYICLKGRIPVKINGTVKKGDYIITDDAGRGKSIGKQPNVNVMHDLIGIALSNSNSEFVEVKI